MQDFEPRAEIPPRNWDALRVGCLVVGAAVVALVLGTCVTVGVVAWRDGWFEDPPKLPNWAYPADSQLLFEDTIPCDIRDDPFPPEYRLMVFGTNRSYEDVRDELEATFRQHGWSVERRVTATEGVDAKKGDHVIWFMLIDDPDRLWASAYQAQDEAERYSTVLQVALYPCS
jgi:hypothetical protein